MSPATDTPATFHYVVKRPFLYDGKKLKKGDRWTPNGGRFDKLIIEQNHLVGIAGEALQKSERARRGRAVKVAAPETPEASTAPEPAARKPKTRKRAAQRAVQTAPEVNDGPVA